MSLGTSYKQASIEGEFDAIVIGSGIGGLASAALLARHADKRVLVLERHYTAGGFTHTFSRPGYEWDVGVHYIGDVGSSRSQLRVVFDDITDGKLEWADMGEVYDSIIIGDDRYDYVKGRRNFIERMTSYFPSEGDAIVEYMRRIDGAVAKAKTYFLEKALPGPVSTVAGPLLRRGVMSSARLTTRSVLEEITDNQRLRGVLAGQYGDYGLPPGESSFFIHALVTSHYFRGGFYPVGGSSRIAATIIPVIEATGGMVVTNADVQEIVVERKRAVGVRLADGRELRAPTIISDAGVTNTYGHLLPREVADRIGATKQLRRVHPSMSHVSLYLGFEETSAALGLEKTNQWVYPSDDHDGNVARYMADPDAPLPVAYLSFPSAKDPDFERRYPDKATVEIVGLAPYKRFARWSESKWKHRGGDYDALKDALSGHLLEALFRRCPQLRDKVAYQELSTPLTTAHFAGHMRGEIYGIDHSPERFAQRWLRPKTPLRGLYMTGADICSGGVGGALFGGVLTVSAMLNRNMSGAIAKRRAARLRPVQGISRAPASRQISHSGPG